MDLHSRKIISHKVGKFMDIKLVMDTLKMAIYKRGDTTNLIIHTDRGSQYMSKEYRKFCAEKGTLESLRTEMYKYIEIWYNNNGIHSKIGFISPNEYEESHKERKQRNCLKIV